MKFAAKIPLFAGLAAAIENYTARDVTLKNGVTRYYEGGCNNDCTNLVFIHGWPDRAETWKHQLAHFAGGNYRVIVPDMRGYGDSAAPKNASLYSLENLTGDLVELAEALDIEKAVWVAHDWGVGVVNSLAAHHPELFLGYALLSVPYRTIELGLNSMKQHINRTIYPEDVSEWGQFDYIRYYELHADNVTEMFNTYYKNVTSYLYALPDPSKFGKPSDTSKLQKNGGWFGGHPEKLGPLPIKYTSLDQSLLDIMLQGFEKNGFFGPTSYYVNSPANEKFAKLEKNGGVLDFPVLYIEAKYDAVCSPSTTPLLRTNQEKFVNLDKYTYEMVEAGHWLHLEKPDRVNEILGQWLDHWKF